ncbi:MAG: hypothetical protein QM610_03235 [Chitinophagaceae bacterium]
MVGIAAPIMGKEILLSHAAKESNAIPLRWIDTVPGGFGFGTTFGLPWKQGELQTAENVAILTSNKQPVNVQSWPLAYWSDGSLKWSAHAIPVNTSATEQLYAEKTRNVPSTNSTGISVKETPSQIRVDTGKLSCTFNKSGHIVVDQLFRNDAVYAKNGQLELINKEDNSLVPYVSDITSTTVEQSGSVRTVIKIVGKHKKDTRSWLPFTLRFYFYRDSDAVKILHTIVFDGDEQKDFIAGLGLVFELPFREAAYNRHIKFADAQTDGVFSEALQNLTGLRRNPGDTVRQNQILGKKILPSDISEDVAKNLEYVPVWGEYSLVQPLPNGYTIQKKTKDGHSPLAAHYGNRSYGVGFVGDTQHGITFGIRNFWQSFSSGISAKNLHTDTGRLQLWLWSPDANAMDLRFYHDGLGEDSFVKERDALDITYEDFEPGFGRPLGVGRTSEIWLQMEDGVPDNQQLIAQARQIQQPLQLVADSDYLQSAAAFGNNWKTPGHSSQSKDIEKRLAFYFDFYKKEVEQRNWYGFWNYGDIMHSYDSDRHNWRYDTGGFAWDNSELSTDLWLWYYFLRTSNKDVFRMAEAMTRHTGEVDVHHIGPFAPLGSRHNVMHWGDSAKQLRISTVANRRFLYYLTADERIGDLMHEQVQAYLTLHKIAPGRKLSQESVQTANNDDNYVNMAFGTDWGAAAAAWFTEWERTKNVQCKTMLENSMRTIADQPKGFFTGGAAMDIHTGEFAKDTSGKISVSHLNASFGLPEILTEINASLTVPSFFQAWVDYCSLYNASEEEQARVLGAPLGKLNLQQGHARLTAYAAWIKKDVSLLQLAWKTFKQGNGGIKSFPDKTLITVPETVQNYEEVPTISTNAVAQWALAAIQVLAYDWEMT